MQARQALRGILSALLFVALPAAIYAADDVNDSPGHTTLDEVTIIGHRRNPADIPGSAHIVGQEELQTFLQSDVMRVLRTVPGVYIQEEEGFGLRPNIGIPAC
jgi:Fe(3+) dicitrate transport protein